MLLHHGNRSATRTRLPAAAATTSPFGVPVLNHCQWIAFSRVRNFGALVAS
jgi:hypothetical protein